MLGIIFDCDGTLIDSEYFHLQSWNEAVSKRGYKLSENEYLSLSGQSSAYISQKLHERVPISSPESIAHDKHQSFYEMQMKGMPPIERTVRFLKQLIQQKSELGIKLAVASAAAKKEILRNLDFLGVTEAFDAVVSGKDDLFHYKDPEGVNKPKPYIYLHTAKLLGLEPSNCVAFEDSGPGVISSASAGLITFAVPNAFTKTHDFSRATYIIAPDEKIDLQDFFKKIKLLTQ